MPIDRSQIRRGAFVRGGFFPGVAKRADELGQHYPEWSGMIAAASPRPSPARLSKLAEERERLSQRMADVKARIDALRRQK